MLKKLLLPILLAAPACAGEITFTQDIAPIIFTHCAACHRPGEAAPFPLLNYSDVKKHGTLIAAVTAARLMPPWKADPAKLLALPKFTEGWQLGTPDLIVKMDKPFPVPAADSYVLPVDVQAVSIGAHAHYIGKTMKMTATFPDGTVKTLLDIQDRDFAWSEVAWDNSDANPKNPSRSH